MSDLVKRLRGLEACYEYAGLSADRIEALEAEVARLRDAHGEQERYLHEADGLQARLTAMTENAEALAVELKEYVDELPDCDWEKMASRKALAAHAKLMEGSDATL